MLIQILFIIGIPLFFLFVFILVRKDRFRSSGAVGNALQEFHSAFEPGVKNTIIEKRIDHVKEDEAGDPR